MFSMWVPIVAGVAKEFIVYPKEGKIDTPSVHADSGQRPTLNGLGQSDLHIAKQA